jgi:filamentous hemagglutinin family protein
MMSRNSHTQSNVSKRGLPFTMSQFRSARSRQLLLSGASLLTLFASQPAFAQTVSGIRGTASTSARPGAPANGAPVTTLPPLAQSALARQNALKARTATAMDLANQAQVAARSAALARPSLIPNGLAAGGLVPAGAITTDPSLWQNAKAPDQVVGPDGKTLVTIDQTAQKAILTWDSFNVGKDTTVYFNQSAGTQADKSNDWVALNRINDPSLKPSEIQGMIKAEGSVYLINRNGILFSGTAQVNTHSLIVSSLAFLQDNGRSIADSNQQFLAGGINDPTLTGAALGTGNGNASSSGDITIEAGADIETGEGGFSIFAGQNVSNAGNIVANGGQTVLAAGVGLNLRSNAAGQLNAALIGIGTRGPDGLLPAAEVLNTGSIIGLRGDIDLLGTSIDQNGIALATTSITQPGNITLTANQSDSGVVSFGASSLTAILPDANEETTSSTPAADDVFDPGTATITGGSVWFQSGSIVQMPGASLTVSAGAATLTGPHADEIEAGRIYIDSGAVISVAGLADVQRPMSDNLITVPRVGQNELADSPLQRDGILYTSPFTVDGRDSGTREDGLSWVGTPVLNASGYVQGAPRDVNQLLVNGGTINFTIGGQLGSSSLIAAPGSIIDVSGGYVHYLGGSVQTSRLIGADGLIYDASTADPMMTYVGFAGATTVSHDRWGVTDNYSNSILTGGYESDYVQGGKGGAINIDATSSGQVILDGALYAQAVAGRYQIGDGKEPLGGSLSVTGLGIRLTADGINFDDLGNDFGAATSLATPQRLARASNDPTNLLLTTQLSGDAISGAGFSNVSLTADMITLDKDATLAVNPGGTVSLTAGRMDISGAIVAHAGKIDLLSTGRTGSGQLLSGGNVDFGGTVVVYPSEGNVPLFGDITVGPDALLDVSGLWVNDRGVNSDLQTGNSFVNGGVISISTQARSQQGVQGTGTYDTTGAIILSPGSTLNASSGGYVDVLGQLATEDGIPSGKGGDISLSTYSSDGLIWTMGDIFGPGGASGAPLTHGTVQMGGTLKDFGFAGGGTLSIQTLGLQIGGDATGLPDYVTWLPEAFFADQGFGGYNLSALYDATVAPGTQINVSQRNYVADVAALALLPTGSDLSTSNAITLGLLDPYHRQPTNFALTGGGYLTWNGNTAANGVNDDRNNPVPVFDGVTGTTLLGEGAAIVADAGADVQLASFGQLTDLGTIVAHGGTVELTGYSNVGVGYDFMSRSVWLGADSLIDVSGIALVDPLAAPIRSGSGVVIPKTGIVLAGGSVAIDGANAFVVAEQGSRIDVSGAAATLDIRQSSSNPYSPVKYSPTDLWSDAGSIRLGSTNGLYDDGTISASGGAPQARGGTLSIYEVPDADGRNVANIPTAKSILLQQSGDVVGSDLSVGQQIEDGATPSGVMHFAVDRLSGSGIDTLVLGNDPTAPTAATDQALNPVLQSIAFSGDVNLSVGRAVMMNADAYVALADGSTDVPGQTAGDLSVGGTHVSINAAYVAMAGGNAANITPTLAGSDATLDIDAGMIDLIGQFGLQRFGDANFTSTGDIRLYTPSPLAYIANSQTARSGELVTAGNLTFKAAQLYPATGNVFILDAPTSGSTITFLGNGSVAPPISVGRALLVDAANIVQDGTIRAPSGTIQLGVGDPADVDLAKAFNNLPLIGTSNVTLGDGSMTSVSLDGRSLPYGTTTDGTDWKLIVQNSVGTKTSTADLTQAPEKLISLAGDNVDFANGATVDLSGGGNVYAQEWVPGTGGSRDLLNAVNTTFSSGAAAAQTPLYPDGRPVYAVIPGYAPSVAAYDPSFGYSGGTGESEVGKSVYLSGVKGLPDGIYTLLPGQYATIPGAFRVVQQTQITDSVSSDNFTQPDGGQIISGRFVDGLTGKSDARTTSFLVQSADVWEQYSEYTISPADDYFPAQASHAGTSATRTPADAGRLALSAVQSLILDGQVKAAAAAKGRGAEVDISAQDIQIIGGDAAARSGYLQVDATSLSNLGVESLLIGGTRNDGADGTTIDVAANSVVLSNDASSALTGPEIILVTKGGSSDVDPNAANGLVLEDGSVLAAKGAIANGSSTPILIGKDGGASGDGALVRVSNGNAVAVIRSNVPGLDGVAGTASGLLDVHSGASVDGGNSATFDSTGNLLLDPGATFAGKAVDVNANAVAFVGAGSDATPNGFVVGSGLLAQLANIGTLGLHSRSSMDFYGDVSLTVGQNLILGANAFTSDGGTVSITAPTLTLTNDVGGSAAAFVAGTGTLNLNAGELDFGAGTMTVQGFGHVTATASQGIVGQGAGSVDFGNLDVAMTAPVFLADNASNTNIKTTGALSLDQGEGTAITRETLGGALSFTGGSVTTDAIIKAVAGNLTLEATSGDLVLNDGATLSTAGVNKTFFDTEAFAPGGALQLTADAGAIQAGSGTTLDFSGAADGGDAGSLYISASGAVTLDGTLDGHAASTYRGGRFTLASGAAIDLDHIADLTNATGISGGLSVTSGAGNLILSAGKILTGQIVYLEANGGSGPSASDGNVVVDGTIDVSGTAAGHIDLYGQSGVDVEGKLLAVSSTPEQDGGVVSIGTSGLASGSLNDQYGYEDVQAANSGSIHVGAGALIDVSGGSADSGGKVSFRAPLLDNGDTLITIDGAGANIKGAASVTIEPYAVWSTADASNDPAKHFDGLIDPAGWYTYGDDGKPVMVAGTWTDATGKILDAPTADQLTAYLSNDYFTPDAANAAHVDFFGYAGGDPANGPGALMGYVQQPGFAFGNRYAAIANVQVRPGMELRNPGDLINGGDISILTNWNLAAGVQDPTSGAITLAYRYGSEAPILTVRAEHDLDIRASITDGFFQQNNGADLQDPVTPPDTGSGDNPLYDAVLASYQQSKAFLDANGLWNGTINLKAGGTADISTDPNYQPIQAPLTGQSNTYYTNYGAYIGEVGTGNVLDTSWSTLMRRAVNGAGFLAYSPDSNPAGGGFEFGDAVPLPSQFSTYADYQQRYEAWLEWEFWPGHTDTTPVPLMQPIDADYGQYSSNYTGVYIPGHAQYDAYLTGGQVGNVTLGTQLFYAPFAPRSDAASGGGGDAPTTLPVGPSTANNSPSNMPVAGSPVSLASATLLGGSSTSYRLIAGADFGAADPMALNSLTGSGSVNLDGHFAVLDSATKDENGNPIDTDNSAAGKTLVFPTVIRTGIGSIDIAAVDDLTWLDAVAPAAIYTGGAPAADAPAAGTGVSVIRSIAPSLTTGGSPNPNMPTLLATAPVQSDNGGDIHLTAGGDISGVEDVRDVDGSITKITNAYIAQYWWPWMATGNVGGFESAPIATSINFGNFDQGVLSAGGDVDVSAGGNINQLSVSLPTTWYLTGDGPRAQQTPHIVGGGDLTVAAGGDILGGSYFVSKGTGRIDAGGSIGPSFSLSSALFGNTYTTPISTLLALQDAQLEVNARGTVDIGGIYNPSWLRKPTDGNGVFFPDGQSYSSDSAVNLTSIVGDINFDSLTIPTTVFGYGRQVNEQGEANVNDGFMLPATLTMDAFNGGITIGSDGSLYPSATGQLSLIADGDIRFVQTHATGGQSFGMTDAKASLLPSILNPITVGQTWGAGAGNSNPASAVQFSDLLLHAQDADPTRIYSLTGDIISGRTESSDPDFIGLQTNGLQIVSVKPAEIEAGRDIVNLTFLGENFYDSDVTSIIAGRDIYDVQGIVRSFLQPASVTYIQPAEIQLGGPGRLDIQAGRDLGPLHGNLPDTGLTPTTGIQTVGNLYNPLLPREGAAISVLFGTGPGVAWDAFAAAYLDPTAPMPDIPSANDDLIETVAQYEADKDKRSGGAGIKPTLTAEQAWTIFQTLPQAQREAVIEKAFFAVLAVTGADENDPASPFFGQYARGYQAIEALFPSALGYTKNNLEGGANGTSEPVATGNLDIRGSTIQTQQGGDINIMGPGGQLLVGSTSAPPFVPAVNGQGGIGPQSQGILAWDTGAINIFSDQSLLLAQSRIFTERGGDMTLWSSNGDINAGKGVKTSSEIKPVSYICDADFFCRINGASQVTGAGIAAFAADPGDPEPTVTLVAPRGTVDFGDAGVRVAGNLIVAAQAVANADNVQVSGTTIGVPTHLVDVNANLAASSTAANAAQEVASAMQQNRRNDRPSIITVTIDGFGLGHRKCDPGKSTNCTAR